ncbi:fructose-bisphosphate aldolase 6, cytosolic-like [Olea europaea subsp. europaea]|uniref:fructose-bisphosphate aldolase n=1 Tax=Olea europaea subsp. europaea TaxID=158383 RepID=A0A8S0UBB4_OLEEU|nr:fructose-bisphosphate aldolase 6, cytosolic-like [Olea europaea subsp. europaea]
MFSAILKFFQFVDELIAIVAYTGTTGKGILATDESIGTISEHLASINVETNRRASHEQLFTTPDALQYVVELSPLRKLSIRRLL